ncbi:molybdopterin dinucleotide binding domain-containing protein [Pseudomonas lini]
MSATQSWIATAACNGRATPRHRTARRPCTSRSSCAARGASCSPATCPPRKKVNSRYPLLLTTGRILSQYNVGAQTRRTDNVAWHHEDRLEIHPTDAESRGINEDDWVGIGSRAGQTVLRARITERVAPGVVYTTFHFPESGGPTSSPPTTPTGPPTVRSTRLPPWKSAASTTLPSGKKTLSGIQRRTTTSARRTPPGAWL